MTPGDVKLASEILSKIESIDNAIPAINKQAYAYISRPSTLGLGLDDFSIRITAGAGLQALLEERKVAKLLLARLGIAHEDSPAIGAFLAQRAVSEVANRPAPQLASDAVDAFCSQLRITPETMEMLKEGTAVVLPVKSEQADGTWNLQDVRLYNNRAEYTTFKIEELQLNRPKD